MTTNRKYNKDAIKINDRVTVHGYLDRTVYEVLRRTENTLILQKCRAERTNRDKDIVTPGGFAAHTSHPEGQKWAINEDPEGIVVSAFWSNKHGLFKTGCGFAVTLSEDPYYDYNF
jgi:hypothetical protein